MTDEDKIGTPKFKKGCRCTKCNSDDTVAILDKDDFVGVVWCNCGYIDIFITEHMTVAVKAVNEDGE